MRVNSIELNNFRNISSVFLESDSGVNVIYGENAQGKTNIIEAIWLFTGCKSFRGSKDAEFIKFGEEFSKIRLDFSDSVRNKKSEITFSDKKKKCTHFHIIRLVWQYQCSILSSKMQGKSISQGVICISSVTQQIVAQCFNVVYNMDG